VNDEAAALQSDPDLAFDGQYSLGAEIGAGALGVVYRGVDERLDKPVAIKVWHARLDEITPLREQYDAEARALTALEHPNLVAITDYGIAGQAPYLIMELLEGETLAARMRASVLPSSLTQTFMESALRGLGYMHMRGVVHRNLKPDNVFLQYSADGTQTLKLLDLSLECLPANSNAAGAATMSLAQRSAYDAPEQEAGAEPDGRSDVYAAGVLLAHMILGHEPSRDAMRAAADSADAMCRMLPHATPEVRTFIARAVAGERSARFGNADQMLRALLELPTPWSDDPPGAAASIAHTEAPPPASVRPVSQAAHADFEGSATSAFHETAQQPIAAENDADLEVGPIGLVARLRARVRLLVILFAGLSLLAAGAGFALWLERSAPDRAATRGVGPADVPVADAKAEAAKDSAKPKAEEAQEGEEEETEAEGEGAQAVQAKAEEPVAPEPLKLSARLGGDQVETKPAAPSDKLILPPPEEPEPAQGESATKPAATAEAKPGEKAAPAHAEEREHAADPAPAGTEPAQHEPAGSAESEHGKATDPSAAAAAPGGEPASAAPAAPAAPEKPKPPTPEEIGSERHTEPDRTEIRQMLALAVARPKPRGVAKNPWDIAVPDSLQALRDAIDSGQPGSAGNIKTLRRYNATNSDDVYGHLLLAGFYANRGYSLDALDQYDMAYRIDPSSRGAPEMLKHALNMVAQGIAEADATRFIVRVYGGEAQNAIAQRLRARDTSAAAAGRLKRLQGRLGSGKRR
jgi:serine/threonine-protein kinase